jgi:DNA-binding NarL/FixJ family response regulator
MAIVCLSNDTSLISSLQMRYGTENVVVLVEARRLEQDLGFGVLAVVVDVSRFQVPASPASPPILALTAVPSIQEAVGLLRAGVRGYGNKKMRKENLYLALESVKAGHLWLPPDILVRLIDLIPQGRTGAAPEEDLLVGLSKREMEVAGYIAQGMTNQVMAEQMFVSLRTIKAHLTSIYDKTGLRNRLELGLCLKGLKNS